MLYFDERDPRHVSISNKLGVILVGHTHAVDFTQCYSLQQHHLNSVDLYLSLERLKSSGILQSVLCIVLAVWLYTFLNLGAS